MKLRHITNFFSAPPESKAAAVIQKTLSSIKHSLDNTQSDVQISVVSSHYPEDSNCVPDWIKSAPHLTQSIQDYVTSGEDKRKLPLIYDILANAIDADDETYIVYTNSDICPYPHFYDFIIEKISAGIDGFAINRLEIPEIINNRSALFDFSVEELLEVQDRSKHIGIDCVVFKASNFKHWPKCTICIGYPPIGQYLFDCTEKYSNRFHWYTDEQLTFHIGRDAIWANTFQAPIWKHNRSEKNRLNLYEDNPWKRHDSKLFPKIKRIIKKTISLKTK